MKAIAKCPKCGEFITSGCRGCIDGKIGQCKNCGEELEDVQWKKFPETEKELNEVESI